MEPVVGGVFVVWHRLSGLVRVGGAGRRTNRSWDFCCSFVPWPQACNCQQPPFCYQQPEALAVAARKSRSLGTELRNAMGTTTAYEGPPYYVSHQHTHLASSHLWALHQSTTPGIQKASARVRAPGVA